MVEIHSATDWSDDQLRIAMQDAFSDYAVPLRLDAASFAMMMRQRGLDRSSSRVAVVDGELAAIWLTALRSERDVATLQTEVLRSNKTGASLYYSLGMKTVRELDCYIIPSTQTPTAPNLEIEETIWRDIATTAASLREWPPSWQNDDLSLHEINDHLLCHAAFDKAELAAFIVASPDTGTVFQLAVRSDRRGNGLGSSLIQKVQAALPQTPLRLINIQQGDTGFRALMTAVGAEEIEGQFELSVTL